jgi:hypothetical protein
LAGALLFHEKKLLTLPHFWRPFGGKDCGLCPYNPSAEDVGGLEVYLHEAAQNFELFSNIKDQNYKVKRL